MGLKEFYHGAEDAYYGFLDTLDRHGIPVYSVVDAVEAQNIPSFPIAVFALLLVVGGLFTLLGPALGGGNGTLSVLIQGETQDPIEGITVTLAGENLPSSATNGRITDSTGKAVFIGLPAGTSVQVRAQGDGYTIDGKSIVIDQGENDISLAALANVVERGITLQLYKPGSTESFTQPLSLSFACSSNTGFAHTTTVTNGTLSLDVPSDCGTLSASSNDPTITLQNTIIDVEDFTPALFVQSTPQGNAVLQVTVIDESGNPVSGIVVALKSKFGDQLAQKFTDGGIAEFTGLVPDTYVIFIPSDGTHGELDSGAFEVDEGAPVTRTFTLQNASVGEVRIQVVDESSLSPVGSAKVTLFKGNQLIQTKTTNEGGQVTFSVSSSNNLTLSIDHGAYLIQSGIPVTISSAGYTQVGMTKATPQNSQIVTVNVIDELGQPVENAYVALKKSPSGASVGPNKITGGSGTVIFVSLEEGTYFASAYKPGFSDQLRSDLFTVKARENVQTTVKLVLGTGTALLTITGSDGQPLAGATVQPIDGITHASFGTDYASGVDGKVELTLRADKYAYFRVTEPNHLPYTTVPLQLKKGITQTIAVEMVKDIQKLEVKILGLFVNGEPILDEAGLAPGQLYTIRMGLFVPKNSSFDEGGIHLRTGDATEGQGNPIENDDWYIRGIRGPYSKLQKGTTFTPPLGLGTDTQHLTSGDAKWANVIMTPISDGITIVEADVQVKDTATQGSDLPLYYRAWGKTGSYVRFPVDAVLGGSESTGQKQGLYATTNLQLFSIGAGTHFCSTDFCLGLVAEDLGNGLQTDITDDYQVDVSTKHRLLFTFTSITDNVLADTSLSIKSTSSGASLGPYDVTNAVGAKKTGTVTGNAVEIPLGIIQTNNVIFGYVNFDAQKEGNAKVTMSLISNKKELFAQDILIKVDAAGEMDVIVTPKAILPLLVNQLLIRVTETGDDIPLENASVEITLNGLLLTSGFTDGEGVFPFELHEPNANDAVEITVEKPGFKPVVLTLTVGSDILEFVPSSISETLTVNGTTKKTRDVHLLNLASIPMTIDDITLTGDFGEWVKFDLLNEELLGSTLGVNGDANLTFSLALTEKGQSLLVGKNVKGSVLVKLSNESTGKTFTGSLPLSLKIGFGGEVDVEDCLLLQPTQWDIFTNTETAKQLAFEVKNTCTVQGSPISLTNLSLKVKQLAGDPLGVFTANAGNQTITLGPDFKTVLSTIPAGGEAIVTVTFDPASIQSGAAEPLLVFQAINPTDNGIPDLLEQTAVVKLAVNDLQQCIQVKTPNLLEIDSCAINTGFGQQGSYNNQVYRPTGVPFYNPSFSTLNKTTNQSGTSLLPSNQSGNYSPFVGAGGYDGLGFYNQNINQQSFSPINGYNTLNGYYGNSYVDSYNGNGGSFASYGCGGTEFRVENSCQTEVEIELDTDPNLQTNTSAFILKPNEDQRVRVYSGYRIGRYDIAVNARTKGSSDASKEIELLSVLIKSPTEVNADCIQLDKTKFRFNDFIQKPVKAKAINKCYDQGVRLVESADTITIASFFNADGALSQETDGKEARKNTLVHDIQIIGQQTRGVGSDTYQEIEFQIFPDLSTYKSQPDLFLDEGGIGKRFSDLKLFAEANYYRVESYGTISVKFLDAYGGAQQKPFAVIFENIFSLASVIDALLQGGSTAITDYQECINDEALQNLQYGDESFLDGTTITDTTAEPNSVMKTGRDSCGTSDTLGPITAPLVMNGKENPLVQATFRTVGEHDVQVTIVRPKNVQGDVTLQGNLSSTITRVFVNPGTRDVPIPVKITVLAPGRTTKINAFTPLACGYGYEKGGNFSTKYGFDKIKWDWTLEGSPDCTQYYCDSTQVLIHT
ncbi:MAG: carboxypeptidase-like regulatory domain-containing protein, partial [archaeon]